MTTQQNELLQFIKQFYKEHKYPPKIAWMTEHFGKKRAQIQQQLASLIEQGYVTNPRESIFMPVDKPLD